MFREKSYQKKGSIDLFITFNTENRKCALLIEAKVHDYSSVTDYQISTYYNAVQEDQSYDDIYFIYLTQFNKKTEFVRTPKYLIVDKKDSWVGKKYSHKKKTLSFSVILESIIAIYSFAGVCISVATLQISALPFQLMFTFGFGLVAYLSIKHVIESNRKAEKQVG